MNVRLPTLRKWEVWMVLVGGVASLAIGVADLFTVEKLLDALWAGLLIVGGVILLLITWAVARRQRSGES